MTNTDRAERVEQLLEALYEQFDTYAAPYSYIGKDGEEVEVTEEMGMLLEETARVLYTDVSDPWEGELFDE